MSREGNNWKRFARVQKRGNPKLSPLKPDEAAAAAAAGRAASVKPPLGELLRTCSSRKARGS